jgi:hypothetical protein
MKKKSCRECVHARKDGEWTCDEKALERSDKNNMSGTDTKWPDGCEPCPTYEEKK